MQISPRRISLKIFLLRLGFLIRTISLLVYTHFHKWITYVSRVVLDQWMWMIILGRAVLAPILNKFRLNTRFTIAAQCAETD